MKRFTALAVAVAALGLSIGSTAFAQSNSPGLTRAEVLAQLQQAQAEGLVPAPKDDYPPSEATIARNREIYAIQHPGEAAAVKTAGAGGVGAAAASN
ncbi:uncharacterized protein DUF4148 [Paraburkholderia sp. RAU2J]|uniref:DUF4148 domain-containing protein n=1 Tax=unclassified Paraburkholderia TaxID=2615204 RepID=UPI000EAC17A4|nr:DUF4148 domain-containing protein [Paraburkholderia sp. RAU2J]RKT13273.1 uncharacterized protein DUF4148 [Paraburkholderia sp. RAU2J]RKT14361.1 uncharacterized protein DUF4148 [Paraburkholderia sp. RAU2J]